MARGAKYSGLIVPGKSSRTCVEVAREGEAPRAAGREPPRASAIRAGPSEKPAAPVPLSHLRGSRSGWFEDRANLCVKVDASQTDPDERDEPGGPTDQSMDAGQFGGASKPAGAAAKGPLRPGPK